MTKPREVIIETREVGQKFGHVGIVRDAVSRRKLVETEDVRPWGYQANAAEDARALAERKGWRVVEG